MNPKLSITHVRVVALAAVLLFGLAIVFPAAGLARGGGKAQVCLVNLNLLGRAWLAYAEDNGGKLVNGHVPRDSAYAVPSQWIVGGGFKDNAWWVNPPHNASGVYTGDPIPCTLADEDNGIRSGKLYPYVGTSAAYHCPADRSYLRTINRGGKRSYRITGLMHGELSRDAECADLYSQIKRPSAKMVFIEDTDDRGWNMGSWIMNGTTNPPQWIDPFSGWHQNRTALGFADGHAELHLWVDTSTWEMIGRGSWLSSWRPGTDIAYMASVYLPKR